MKNTSFGLLFLLTAFWGLSLSFPQSAGATTPGIYKTVDELNAANPSLPLSYSTSEIKVRCGVYGLGKQSVTFSKLKLTRKEAHELNKIIAFSDSQNVYVKVNKLKIRKISRFAKTESIGKYLYYWDVAYNTTHRKGGGLVWWLDPVQRLYNKDNGKRIDLNVINLKKIIADKPALLDSFKHENHKAAKLKEYLVKYYQS